MKLENYDLAKQAFIEQYNNYEKSNDLGEFVHNVVIPYFDMLACDLEEIITTIISQTTSSIQVLDYIELIFNSKLYDSYLSEFKNMNPEQNYSHYLVILVENTKYNYYQDIKQSLHEIEVSHETKDTTFIQEVLMKATDERCQYCLDKMKQTFKDLLENHSQCANSICACKELFYANNISIEYS